MDLQRKQEEQLKSTVERIKGECGLTIKQLEVELESINADIDRQVNLRLNDRFTKEQHLNESIIRY